MRSKLPNGKMLEFNLYKADKHCILPIHLSNIHGFYNEFRTVYDHASFIENLRLANFNRALSTTKELWKLGLLIRQSDFLDALAKKKAETDILSINALSWISRNRTESLRHSIESFLKCLEREHRQYDYLVFDDSTPKNYTENKHNIHLLNEKYLTKIRLVGEIDKKLFLGRLIKKLKGKVPEHVVKYGMFGLRGIKHRTGANRNAFLLFTTGKLSLLIDDDIFCQFSKNGNDEKLTLTSDATFSDVSSKWFSDTAELTGKVKFDRYDPTIIHEKLLGLSVGRLVQKYGNQIELNGITPKFALENLTSDKRVRVTMMGVAGDSGAGSPISKIFLSCDKLIPLITDPASFMSKMYSRMVLQSYKSFTIGPPNFLLGMNLGIDNTEILPPFHPNFRNSDGIFASVLNKCFRNCFIGHLPFAISHIPPDIRQVDPSELTTTSVRIPDMLRYSIDEYKIISESIQNGLRSLGIYLREISEKSNEGLRQYLNFANTNMKSAMICRLELLLKHHGYINKKWASIAEQRIETLYKSIQNQGLWVQFKEITHLPNQEQIEVIRRVYGNFGDLLFYWPEIYECASGNKKMLTRST